MGLLWVAKMQCKRLNWENEGPGLFYIWPVALKHKLTEVLRGSLSHCLLTKSIVRPSTAPGNLRVVERVGFFRHIRLGTEMPFTFHAEFDETKIDFRMLRNSRENETDFVFSAAGELACPRWFCVALAVDADGEGMAGVWRARSIPSSSRTCGLRR